MRARLYLALACCCSSACFAGSNRDALACPAPAASSTQAPLFGAAPDAELLALGAREANGVVALVTPRSLCTGVLVAASAVLTAAHCIPFDDELPEIRIGSDSDAPEWATPARRLSVHPELDLALLTLQTPVPDDLALPLEPLRVPLDLIDQRAQLAGYGLTERNTIGVRLFTDEVVIDDSGHLITVDGEGERGACLGDSGGPLLVRDGSARVRIVGVLSQGSASCVNIDQYVLLHRATEWLDAVIAEACGG